MFQKEKREKLIFDTDEWFIIIDNQQVGPYALSQLKKHPKFTPDTLVWKKGFKEWTKARFVPELQELFKDDPEPCTLHQDKGALKGDLGQESQATLTLQQDPYQFLLWILLLIIVLFYTFFYHF